MIPSQFTVLSYEGETRAITLALRDPVLGRPLNLGAVTVTGSVGSTTVAMTVTSALEGLVRFALPSSETATTGERGVLIVLADPSGGIAKVAGRLIVDVPQAHGSGPSGALLPPVIPPDGVTLLGVQSLIPGESPDPNALAAFFTATEQSSVAIFNRFTPANGTFAGALSSFTGTTSGASVEGADGSISWNFTDPGGLAAIANGAQDAYMTARAEECRDYGQPLYLRPWWEFNINAYSWSAYQSNNTTPRTGNSPDDFIAAWRRMVGIFRTIAPNVSFCWISHLWEPPQVDALGAGAAGQHATDWYPGADYVDWIGSNAYLYSVIFGDVAGEWGYIANEGRGPYDASPPGWGLDQVVDFANAQGKPVMLGEWAFEVRSPLATNSDIATRFGLFKDWLVSKPRVKAIVYFQFDNTLFGTGPNFRLDAIRASDVAGNPAGFAYRDGFVNGSGVVPGRWRQSPYPRS